MTAPFGKSAFVAGAILLQASLVAFLVLLADRQRSSEEPTRVRTDTAATDSVSRSRADVIRIAPLPSFPGGGWRVIHQMSAHYMLVLKVETDRVHEARQIAQTLVEPLKDSYVEVLVYFHRPGTKGRLAARRVQWTKGDGYVETDYEH